jgi:hypothetical protein
MAFWNDAAADPKRKYRFLIKLFGGDVAWYVKSVTAPSYEITSIEHAFSDHVFNFPGKIKWSDVEVTLVDPAGADDVVYKTLDLIRLAGYSIPNLNDVKLGKGFQTFTKSALVTENGNLELETHDSAGFPIEIWTLHNAFITNVKFGDFDYSSEDMREISLTFKYDWASCEFPGEPEGGSNDGAQAETFFGLGTSDDDTGE